MSTEEQYSGPPNRFMELNLIPPLCDVLCEMKWSQPTHIQCAAIPPALEGKDIIGIAETGSGKTGAFLLPIIQHWIRAGRPTGFALLLAPTRELAQQLATEACRLGSPLHDQSSGDALRVVRLVGGEDMVEQALQLAWHRHHLIVATPGRLVDHIKQSPTFAQQQLSQIRQLVLDEADRMLNMAFAEDMDLILDHFQRPLSVRQQKKKARRRNKALKLLEQIARDQQGTPSKPLLQTVKHAGNAKFPHPQTHLYSATMTKDVAKLRRAALSPDAVLVSVDQSTGSIGLSSSAVAGEQPRTSNDHLPKTSFPCGLVHYCLPMRLVDKPAILDWLVREDLSNLLFTVSGREAFATSHSEAPRTIVFCKRCQETRLVSEFLRQRGHSAVGLTGQLKQAERTQALTEFTTGHARILVATDVASRGLDIPDVELVINYSVPLSEKTYRHRVGRTARAGQSGVAVTMVTRDVAHAFLELEALLAPHLPVTGADVTVMPRWPIPLPGPSGKYGMLIRRRLADEAWARAGKIIRAQDEEKHQLWNNNVEDSDSSESVAEPAYSQSDSFSDEEVSNEETQTPSGDLSAVSLNTSGLAGISAARSSWKQMHQDKKIRHEKRRVARESNRNAATTGWGLHTLNVGRPGEDENVQNDVDDEVEHLQFAETLKTKYAKLQDVRGKTKRKAPTLVNR
ncbi:ATP-dependent rRNA helicase RRP3 [Paragonimus heterotremus]|uniref:RNA helicase n=1 Tax=Paragonimus heterotremus TaxID=100268 RepID=A0A8J4ST77_9TREM|nr:ATP-dependent rRNA helicase RRP3 [Paragonimus heterotremus]